MLRAFRATRYYLPPRTPLQAHHSALRLSRSTFPLAPSLLQQPLRTPSVAPISTRAKLSKGQEPETALSEDFEEIEPTPVPQQVVLRPYQIECITAVLSELQRGTSTRLGVSAPTGSGKTSIFTRLISLLPPLRHPQSQELATRVLIIVNSIQLAHQTFISISRAYPDWHVEIEQGAKHKASGLADVTIATFQTLGRDGGRRLDKFETENCKAVIIDEAHHAVSKTYLSILSRFDSEISDSFKSPESILPQHLAPIASPITPAPSVGSSLDASPSLESESSDPPPSSPRDEDLASLPDEALPPVSMRLDDLGRPRVPLLAFSATWSRADGLALGKVFEKIVYHAEWLDMIRSNWLSELKFTTLRIADGMNLDNVEVSKQTGDFVLGSLIREVDRPEVNEVAVRTWLEKASDRRSTLVFAISISHILSLTNTFRNYGIDARFVYQNTKPAEREVIYEGFRNGDFKVLVNCGILTEGADFPSIDCVLLLRPTRSQTLFLQMLGRGLRLSPATGKKDCLVIDLVGSATKAGGMVCTPTLFGIDPDAAIEGQSTSTLRQLGQEEQERLASLAAEDAKKPRQDLQLEYTDYETAFDYVSSGESGTVDPTYEADANGLVRINKISKLAWIGCGQDVWVLELLGKGHVKIVKTKDGYVASLYQRLPSSPFDHLSQSRGNSSPFMTPRLLALHSSLAALIRSTDQFLRSKEEYRSLGLARSSPWRTLSSSRTQQNYILKKLMDPDLESRQIDGVWIGRKPGTAVMVDDLTKGQASDVISRAKHGGLGYVKKLKKDYERGLREILRVEGKNRKVGEKLKKELEEVERRRREAQDAI